MKLIFIVANRTQLAGLNGGAIIYNKLIQKLAKQTLDDYINAAFVPEDPALNDLWWPFHNSVDHIVKTFPDSALQRGLAAFTKGVVAIQSSEILDLAAGKLENIAKNIFFLAKTF